MTYLSFLGLFLAPPLALALALALRASKRGRAGRAREMWVLLAHVVLAVAYTTPWDNYLVAARVWTYAPARVLGLTLGWVPLEEYLFFVLQTVLAGLIAVWLLRARPAGAVVTGAGGRLKPLLLGGLAAAWLASVLVLAGRWQPGTYLALLLAWALPPIGLQLWVGADLLWQRRWPVLAALLPLTLYLCAADTLALRAGVWQISPAQSLNVRLGSALPIEEAIFFLLTNALVVFGMTLALTPETWARFRRGPRFTAARPLGGPANGA